MYQIKAIIFSLMCQAMGYLITVTTEQSLDNNTVQVLILDKDASGSSRESYRQVDRRLLKPREPYTAQELEEASDDEEVELDSVDSLFKSDE